ncbi:MAG TPA: nuclear transport factor 2 family protein [Bacteroidales bacterium]|nr:nuclear transport factor 2 family protein [Bacteroidales bacterium]
MKPKALITKWIGLFDAADAAGIEVLDHEEAVNHQVANAPVIGKQAIREMFEAEFKASEMRCIPENIVDDGEWGILEWKDPLGLRGCGFFHVVEGKIRFQRGYWDKLSFLRMQKLPIPKQ